MVDNILSIINNYTDDIKFIKNGFRTIINKLSIQTTDDMLYNMDVNMNLYKFGKNIILQIPNLSITNKTNKIIITYNTNKVIELNSNIKIIINDKEFELLYCIKPDNIVIDLSNVLSLSEKPFNIKSFNIIYDI